MDYPRVRVLSFERLPTPEALDDMSDAAARKASEWHRRNPDDPDWLRRGINLTPEIETACQTELIARYRDNLASLPGREIEPRELLPPLPVDRHFKRAFPIPNTRLFLSLHEGDPAPSGERTAEIQTLCEGSNLGSAGGPTLMVLGPIARLAYRDVLHQEGIGPL